MGERIAGAAALFRGVTVALPPPARHSHVLLAIQVAFPDEAPEGPHHLGFVTDAGRFVGREEAMLIASAAGQVTLRREGPGFYQGPDLYSEDVW